MGSSILNQGVLVLNTAFLISLIPGLIAGLSYVSYIRSIQAGTTKTPPSTRFIMTVVYAITAWSMYKTGVMNWQFAAICLGSLAITGAALWYDGMWKWSKYDTGCALASALIIVVWLAASSPTVALYASLAVQFVAWLATIHKTLAHPDTQDPVAFTLVVISAIVQIAIQEERVPSSVAQPIVSGVIAATMVYIVATKSPGTMRDRFGLYIPFLRRG